MTHTSKVSETTNVLCKLEHYDVISKICGLQGWSWFADELWRKDEGGRRLAHYSDRWANTWIDVLTLAKKVLKDGR
jgi:hypothetical protein